MAILYVVFTVSMLIVDSAHSTVVASPDSCQIVIHILGFNHELLTQQFTVSDQVGLSL